jgi:hypothetical protein
MAEVKTIDINGIPLKMDEDTAMLLVKNIFDQFNWQGTFFIPEDVRTAIVHRFFLRDSDPPEGDELERLVEAVMGEADWENIGEWMTERCSGTIVDAVCRTIDKEDN